MPLLGVSEPPVVMAFSCASPREHRPVYTEIFDGLRNYYAGYESRRAAAGFNAAMAMSFLFCITITAALPIADYFINGSIEWSVALFANKPLLILAGIIIAYAHVRFGKRTGRYNSAEPAPAPHWKAYLSLYATGTTLLFVVAIFLAFRH
jgi:hypothetical protein